MRMKRFNLVILVALFGLLTNLSAQVRNEFLLEKNWKFTREDNPDFIKPAFDDSKWQSVTVPHDWAIYGPFSSQNDKQEVAISQDGQKEAMEHAGRTGGLPFVGVGWYRIEFEVPQFAEGKKASILFDGAMSHAKVYINGEEVGYWPYGYNSFHFDITKYLKPEQKNTLAVRLETCRNHPLVSRSRSVSERTCDCYGRCTYPCLGNVCDNSYRKERICQSECKHEGESAGRS